MSKILANQIANYGDDAPIEIKEGLNIPAGKPIQAAGISGTSGQVLSTTGTSIAWVDTFNGDYNNLTNRPTIPVAQVNSDWNASSGVAVILNKPAVPPLPSVTVGVVGSSTLSYNSGNGEFTFTPPDLSDYDTAYGWGNHASAGYLTSLGDAAGVTTAKISNWDAAYGWGDHSGAGYLTSYSEADTLDSVLTRGATTTQDITTTGKLYYSNNFADLTALNAVSASTYHGMFAHVHAEGHGYFGHAGGWMQLLDTSSSIDELGDVDLAIAPVDGYVLKWEASSSSWKAFPDLVGTSNAGITLQDLSVQTATAGSTALSYSNTTGVFTYTPPDLSGYLTTETDPVFSASPAGGILSSNISNWDAAYGWGNHATAGYAADTNVANWDAAYGWGDHGVAGYLTSEADTLNSVTGRGSSTTNSVSLGGIQLGTLTQLVNSFGNTNTLKFGGDMTIFHMQDGTFGTSNRIIVDEHNLIIGTKGETPDNYYTNLIEVNVGNDLGSTSNTADVRLGFGNVGTRLQTTAAGVTITGALTADALVAGGLTYPTTNGTSGDVLTSDGAGNITWAAPTGGGGGANVTISDTIPAGTPAAGDLWWESDSGRLKVYYTDVDSSQWIDASPPLSYDNINDVISANGFKFRVNESSPPAGTLGELRQIDSKPHFFDGTSWQEFILGSTSAITLPAETAWDNVIVRTTFDNDANDYRFGATGALDTLSSVSIVNSSLVESPVKVGTKALKSVGSGVKYPHRSEYVFDGEFTIEFWIYFDDANISSSINGGEQEIISKSNASFNAGSWSLITYKDSNANRRWRFKHHDIATNSVTTNTLESTSGAGWNTIYPQKWVHIAITKDNNGALHFYRDGTEDSATSPGGKFANDISNNNYDLIIGGGVNTTTNCFDGFIDGLRITTDTRYDSIGTNGTPAFTPPTSILPISGSTTTYTPPATSSAGSFTLGSSPAWTGTLGVTVAQQSSGNYRLTFTNPFTNATDYYVFAHHMDGAEAMVVASVRSTGYVDFSVKNVAGSLIDTGSLAVQIIAH